MADAIEIEKDAFPEDTLTMVGTAGNDDLYIDLGLPNVQLIGLWNESNSLRRGFELGAYNALRLILLDGDDSLLVDGDGSLALFVEGGRGNDWIQVDTLSDTSVIDLSGNNYIQTHSGSDEIRTGTGRDKVDAGDGINKLYDAGGVNWLFTGNQDDEIYYQNANDWISAGEGINQIWLNGSFVNWQNPSIRFDVNRDEDVTALDALVSINQLQRERKGYELQGSPDSTSFFYDTSNDGNHTAHDVLLIINELSRATGAEGESVDAGSDLVHAQSADYRLASDQIFSEWEPETDQINSVDGHALSEMEGIDSRRRKSRHHALDSAFIGEDDEWNSGLEGIHFDQMIKEMDEHFQGLKAV